MLAAMSVKRRRVLLAGALLAVFACGLAMAGESRTWTSRDGQTLKGVLVEVADGRAVLQLDNGRQVAVAVDSFGDADQARVAEWVKSSQGTGAVTTPASPAELATFADGRFKGANLVYQSRFYVARMDAEGKMELQPMADGQAVGKPIGVTFGCYYHDPEKKKTIGRPVVEFSAPPVPQIMERAGQVKLAGRFADEVKFTMVLKFSEKQFSLEGEIKDPSGLKSASTLNYHARIQPTHKIGPEMELEQIKALMPDWTLKLTPLQGRAETYPYWKSLNGQKVERAEIRGPWQGCTVTLQTPAVSIRKTKAKAGGIFAIYRGMPPYGGYHVGRSGTTDQEAGELRVIFQ